MAGNMASPYFEDAESISGLGLPSSKLSVGFWAENLKVSPNLGQNPGQTAKHWLNIGPKRVNRPRSALNNRLVLLLGPSRKTLWRPEPPILHGGGGGGGR